VAWQILDWLVAHAIALKIGDALGKQLTVHQTERARKKLEAEGPTPDNIRMIPYFNKRSGKPALSITLETSPF